MPARERQGNETGAKKRREKGMSLALIRRKRRKGSPGWEQKIGKRGLLGSAIRERRVKAGTLKKVSCVKGVTDGAGRSRS